MKIKQVLDKRYQIREIETIDSPALLIFADIVKKNIQTAITMAGNPDRLRPHVKTHKSPDVTKLMINAGITKFKSATIAETEMLGQCGAKDVLLAYQPLGPKLNRFIAVIKKYPATSFSCLADNRESMQELSNAFTASNLLVNVYIDLNIGMNRTGIAPGPEASKLYQFGASLPGIKMGGLHAYDGQLRNPDITARTRECNEGFAPVEQLKSSLQQAGFSVPNVVAGGSPSFPIHAKRPDVECSPGTFIYWDKGYSDLCPEQDFFPAALLLTRIISLPSPARITTDLGHKSVSAENEITRRVHFLTEDTIKPVGQSEEHLVLETAPGHSYNTGDLLLGIPFHVCPTIALYERGIVIDSGQIIGEWKNTSRDRKLTI